MRFWNLRFGFATIVAVMLSSAAAGEEMRAGATSAVPYQWSHYYIGAYGGYGWGDPSGGWSGNSAAEAVYLSSGGLARSTTFNPRGYLGGLHAGYDHQLGRFVVGIETDMANANIRGSGTSSGNTITFVDSSGQPLWSINNYSRYQSSAGQALRALGSLRVRAGFLASDRVLIYGTGGLAYGRATLSASVSNTETNNEWVSSFDGAVFWTEQFAACRDICTSGSVSRWLVGGAVGAGLEYAFIDRWSARIEYLYYNLGTLSVSLADLRIPAYGFNASALFAGHIARFGLTYHFN
jgi:outer membrane immunogenic protein